MRAGHARASGQEGGLPARVAGAIGLAAALLAGTTAAQERAASAPESTASAASADADADANQQRDAARAIRLRAGSLAFDAGRFAEAERLFGALVADIETDPRKPDIDYFCATSKPEALFYLLQATSNKDSGRGAVVLSATLCHAMFGQAFALVELRRLGEARATLERLLRLAPINTQFLIEYGNLLNRLREPAQALTMLKRAEAHVNLMPETTQARWRATALRSQGYSLVELGRLDEAEAAYRRSLEAVPAHPGALAEIQYIRDLKKGAVKP